MVKFEDTDILKAFFDYYAPEILESEVARRTFVLPR